MQRLLPVISRDIHHFINTISYLRVDDARHPNLHVSQEIKDAINGRLEILTNDFFVAVAFHFFSVKQMSFRFDWPLPLASSED